MQANHGCFRGLRGTEKINPHPNLSSGPRPSVRLSVAGIQLPVSPSSLTELLSLQQIQGRMVEKLIIIIIVVVNSSSKFLTILH